MTNATKQRLAKVKMTGRLAAGLLALAALSISTNHGGIRIAEAFYLPGVNPQSFAEGDA